jgi:predicted RNA binding protein YcfA (HicA-like mRNA interferase family)
MGERWPSLRGRQLAQIIERHCGAPERRSGSHRLFRSPYSGQLILFSYHDRAEVTGDVVRRILITELGLSKDDARKEAR